MKAEHKPEFSIPLFKGTSPDKFRCSERENGCTFEIAVAGGLTRDEAEAKFIAEHTVRLRVWPDGDIDQSN